jgi:predicted metalloendopeptidase
MPYVIAQEVLKSGIELSNVDQSIRPQDDFYRYVNGTWLDKTEIPADKSSYGSFTALRDKARLDVLEIIEEMSKRENLEPGSDEQKVRDLYRSFMNTEKIDTLGIEPMKGDLRRIDMINNPEELASYFVESVKLSTSSPFGFWIDNDSKQPTKYSVYFTQSGLGLPDRSYYLDQNEKSEDIRLAYLEHLQAMFSLADLQDPKIKANTVMKLETAIANIHWTNVERRDRDKTYNKLNTQELKKLIPNFNWDLYLKEAGIAVEKDFIVRELSYFQNLADLLASTDLEDWKVYFKWTLLNSVAGILGKEFDEQNFSFYGKKLYGTPEQEVRWKRGVNSVNQILGESVGKIYVRRHFKPEAKVRMLELVENLREAYRVAIIDLDWMGEETKKEALTKLAKFTPKIGYPDKWRDYSKLEIDPNDLAGNFRRASQFYYQRGIDKLGKPIDKTEWHMNPQTVNAYYNSVMNEIVFPAAILQPPFFNLEADDAVNYGGIGGVIGHEMGHGFDDQGSKSDGDGVLRNWWTESDLIEFKTRTNQLVNQYNKFEPLPGEFINGQLTLGENIGDLGGLTIAHRAYKISLQNRESKKIDEFTGEQRFFMGWAQVWAYKYRDEALRNQLLTNPHSPASYRCNGVLRNMPEFVSAYELKAADEMYLDPVKRVKIW